MEESCSSRISCAMCCRSTTVKRFVLTSASSSESVIGRLPTPVMSPTATFWYGAMLISAGLITGTRTATDGRFAVTASGIIGRLGRTSVNGPGQNAFANISASSGQTRIRFRAAVTSAT